MKILEILDENFVQYCLNVFETIISINRRQLYIVGKFINFTKHSLSLDSYLLMNQSWKFLRYLNSAMSPEWVLCNFTWIPFIVSKLLEIKHRYFVDLMSIMKMKKNLIGRCSYMNLLLLNSTKTSYSEAETIEINNLLWFIAAISCSILALSASNVACLLA